jgi:hypothetical protein
LAAVLDTVFVAGFNALPAVFAGAAFFTAVFVGDLPAGFDLLDATVALAGAFLATVDFLADFVTLAFIAPCPG